MAESMVELSDKVVIIDTTPDNQQSPDYEEHMDNFEIEFEEKVAGICSFHFSYPCN